MPASARYTVSRHEKQGSADGHQLSGDANVRSYRQSLLHGSEWPPASFKAQPTPALIRAARARATTASDAYSNKPTAVLGIDLSTGLALSGRAPRAMQMHARALAAQAAHQQRMAEPNVVATPMQNPGHSDRHIAAPSFSFGEGFLGFSGVPFGRHADGGVDGRGKPSGHDIQIAAYPLLNLEERCRDIIDEIQVDLSLPLVDDSASTPSTEGYTSPSAPVDISAFLPVPGPPALIANDSTIAASAVPLADWAAELCWHIVFGSPLTAGIQATQGTGILSPEFVNFRAFVNSTLSATLPSPSCLFLGLHYISKLPLGWHDLLHEPADIWASASNPLATSQLDFHNLLANITCNVYNGQELYIQLLFTLGLTLSNKWLEDNTFTTRTWHEVTSLQQEQLKNVETSALKVLKFSLSVTPREWLQWILKLRSVSSALVAKEPIGLLGSANSHAIRRLDDLIRLDRCSSLPCNHVQASSDDDTDIVLIPTSRDGQRSVNGTSCSSCRSNFPQWNSSVTLQNPHPGRFAAPLPYERPLYVLHEPMAMFGRDHPYPMVPGQEIPNNRQWNLGTRLPEVGRGVWDNSWSRWDRVEAEIAAQDLQQEAPVSGWPRPSVLGMSWTRQSAPSALFA